MFLVVFLVGNLPTMNSLRKTKEYYRIGFPTMNSLRQTKGDSLKIVLTRKSGGLEGLGSWEGRPFVAEVCAP